MCKNSPTVVYIASPYGDHNDEATKLTAVNRQLDCADELRMAGFTPIVPLTSHYWDSLHPHNRSWWMDLCFDYVCISDYLIRLPGESIGADAEVDLALARDIPVFYSVQQLLTSLMKGIHNV